MKQSVRRVLRAVCDTLAEFGTPYTPADLAATTRPYRHTGPGADRAERVPGDVLFTPPEQALLRELLRAAG